MKCRSLLLSIAIAVCCILLPSYPRADIPASTLRDMQDRAPEALRVHVLSVNQQSSRREFKDHHGQQIVEEINSVTAMVRVEAVLRSASGLKRGGVITIKYDIVRRTPVAPGERPPAILKDGETVRAYLEKTNNAAFYSPAAFGNTFVAP